MYVTIMQTNSGECPCWNVRVSVHGYYGERSDCTWTFLRAKCPIVENSKLPIYEQSPKYKYMVCDDPRNCPLYTEFQPLITSDI